MFDMQSVEPVGRKTLAHLAEMGDKLKQLQKRYIEATAVAEEAKKEYEHFAHVVMPMEMASCGLDSVALSTGGTVRVKHNYYCQPNKNPADRKIIVDWLREHGGDYLIDSTAVVSSEDIHTLQDMGVPYVESTQVNTARLKAFIKDGIGVSSGTQQFTIDELPPCMHFQDVVTVEVDL